MILNSFGSDFGTTPSGEVVNCKRGGCGNGSEILSLLKPALI
jgi:hypothetical protein